MFERSESRQCQRNRHYERDFVIRIGTLQLKVNLTRDVEFSSQVPDRYQLIEKLLLTSML